MNVYLNLSEKRLILSEAEINDKNYWRMFASMGNYQLSVDTCKAYCMGVIHGNQMGLDDVKVVNTQKDFDQNVQQFNKQS